MTGLQELHKKIGRCRKCDLFKERNKAVPGEGDKRADIMFIGEAPGKNEDKEGRPFVGAAGKLLNELLFEIGLNREDVFITSILKCRPPKNRDPLKSEIKKCIPYLLEQVSIIRPKLIVTLGRHAMNVFLPDHKIANSHGKLVMFDGIYSKKQAFFPMYHPAFALYNANNKDTLIKDIKKIPKLLEKIG